MELVVLVDGIGRRKGMVARMGFVVDVVGYGRRDVDRQRHLQERLSVLMSGVPELVGVQCGQVQSSGGLGDGAFMFFSADIDVERVLPRLLRVIVGYVETDNWRYRDRMRVRMSVGFGLVGQGALGYAGALPVELSRLNDSSVIRQAIREHDTADVVVLVSHLLCDLIGQSGSRSGGLPPLKPVVVTAKEYCAPAWMWVCGS